MTDPETGIVPIKRRTPEARAVYNQGFIAGLDEARIIALSISLDFSTKASRRRGGGRGADELLAAAAADGAAKCAEELHRRIEGAKLLTLEDD